jgi:hypothetical protein
MEAALAPFEQQGETSPSLLSGGNFTQIRGRKRFPCALCNIKSTSIAEAFALWLGSAGALEQQAGRAGSNRAMQRAEAHPPTAVSPPNVVGA